MRLESQRGGLGPIDRSVAVTYNLKRPLRTGASRPLDADSEFDSPATIAAIADALCAGGHAVSLVEADERLPRWFLTHDVDAVFNIAEGTHGQHRESQVPAILEFLGIPFTGSNSIVLALALDKAKTKQILAHEGLATPAWQLFPHPTTTLNPRLRFPLIVKPNGEGSAKGILRDSVVWDGAALRRQVRRILEQYRQEALIEEFIDGTELTVGVLGNDRCARVLPVLEIDFSRCAGSGEFFYSWRMKEYQGDARQGLTPSFHCPARVSPEVEARVKDAALRAHRALGCADFSRTDIRLRDGVPYILEVNPLPGLDPLESNFPRMTAACGISYPALINALIDFALARTGKGARPQEPSPCPPGSSKTVPADRLVASRIAP